MRRIHLRYFTYCWQKQIVSLFPILFHFMLIKQMWMTKFLLGLNSKLKSRIVVKRKQVKRSLPHVQNIKSVAKWLKKLFVFKQF